MTSYELTLLNACDKSSRSYEENLTYFVSMGINSLRAQMILEYI